MGLIGESILRLSREQAAGDICRARTCKGAVRAQHEREWIRIVHHAD